MSGQGGRQAVDREALAGERDVLLASLEDLEREHLAGDVDDTDYATLRADYVARAASTLRALEALGPGGTVAAEGLGEAAGGPGGRPGGTGPGPGEGTPSGWARLRRLLGRRRSRLALGLAGTCCALGLLAIAAAHLAGVRLPGQVVSGTVQVPEASAVRQQLAQASVLGSTGHQAEAVALYGQILTEVPNQPEALTYRGWLVRLAGLADHQRSAVREGDAQLALAVKVAPRYPDARALDGMALLLDDGQVHLAVRQFGAFLADHPSHQLLQLLGSDMAAAYAAAHLAVPAPLRPYVRRAS